MPFKFMISLHGRKVQFDAAYLGLCHFELFRLFYGHCIILQLLESSLALSYLIGMKGLTFDGELIISFEDESCHGGK
jgi:hypothetical protein